MLPQKNQRRQKLYRPGERHPPPCMQRRGISRYILWEATPCVRTHHLIFYVNAFIRVYFYSFFLVSLTLFLYAFIIDVSLGFSAFLFFTLRLYTYAFYFLQMFFSIF